MNQSKFVKIILAIIPAIIMFLLVVFEPLYSLDTMFSDKLYSQMNGTGTAIKIISIDEDTLAEYGPFSTWIRDKSADLIDVLYSDAELSPSVLAFDVMFIGNTDESIDNKLANAASKVDGIVAATNIVYKGKTKYLASGMPYYDAWNIDYEELPFDALNKNVDTGYTNVSISKDGFVRSTQVYINNDGDIKYGFPGQIYNVYKRRHGENVTIDEIVKNKQVQFFYSGKPGEFIRYSMKDVLDGKIPATEFADCIVLVGAYATGLQDSYHSAAKRGKDMYGVEINANIVNALLLGRIATPVPAIILAVIFAIIIAIYTYLAREMKMYPAILIGIWIIMANIIVGRILASDGKIISLIYLPIMCILVMAWVIIEKYVFEIVKKKQVLDVLRKYMAPQVIDNMAKDELYNIQLTGENRHVAVLFVDIRGFTSMSEALPPEEVVKILNEYLTLTTKCIFEHGGMLDKFIGDATMAIFNAPNDQDDYVYQAVMTAIDMQTMGNKLSQELLKKYGKEVSFGIGVNAGNAVVGNIGSETRMDYTAIGDTVNTAARLESRALAGEILISEEVNKLIGDRIKTEFKDTMSLKGKSVEVNVYKVVQD